MELLGEKWEMSQITQEISLGEGGSGMQLQKEPGQGLPGAWL